RTTSTRRGCTWPPGTCRTGSRTPAVEGRAPGRPGSSLAAVLVSGVVRAFCCLFCCFWAALLRFPGKPARERIAGIGRFGAVLRPEGTLFFLQCLIGAARCSRAFVLPPEISRCLAVPCALLLRAGTRPRGGPRHGEPQHDDQ